jgi:hypothetical protein
VCEGRTQGEGAQVLRLEQEEGAPKREGAHLFKASPNITRHLQGRCILQVGKGKGKWKRQGQRVPFFKRQRQRERKEARGLAKEEGRTKAKGFKG